MAAAEAAAEAEAEAAEAAEAAAGGIWWHSVTSTSSMFQLETTCAPADPTLRPMRKRKFWALLYAVRL